ncbi:MAG: 23S rRNA (guanosine(2251)-2'-O)-methyltransferase RlmB [Chloroflexota bacterium]|nr:23S rRNA (guanosine(2251)-2'-O)-methyltransferase RlmB [Chloroflexota bacterium]
MRAGRRKSRLLLLTEGTDDRKTVADLAELAGARGVEVEYVSRTELERRAPGVNHQGAILEVGPYPYADYDDLLAATRENPNALLLVLDSVQDPQNLGTLLRTAEAAGVTGVVIPEHRAVQVTPAVVNASAGAVEHLPVAVVTNLVRAVEQAKEAGAWVIAAEAAPDAVPPASADLTGPLVLVIGSEGQGIGRLLRETCDLTVRIPLVGKVGSLNAATAGSILLYEVVRQRMEDEAMSDLVSSITETENV